MMSYNETVKKLVGEYGYPRALMEKFEFDPNYMVRGLIVDKRRGNILKMDRTQLRQGGVSRIYGFGHGGAIGDVLRDE